MREFRVWYGESRDLHSVTGTETGKVKVGYWGSIWEGAMFVRAFPSALNPCNLVDLAKLECAALVFTNR